MSHQRRYNEQEIAAIFKRAAADQEAAQRQLSAGGGLTLAEIEAIGKEAGITPAFIARAAAALDRTAPAPPPTTLLGLPISVAHAVELPGAFSEEDWDRLVVDLRETFQAPGEVRRDGALRQWRNGNLHALVEPTDGGHRLRFGTLSDAMRSRLVGSAVFFVMGLFFMLLVAAKGDFGVDLGDTLFVTMFAVLGMGGLGVSAYQLSRWRAQRERQMEAVAARALERAGAYETTASRAAASSPLLDEPREEAAEAEPLRVPRKTRS